MQLVEPGGQVAGTLPNVRDFKWQVAPLDHSVTGFHPVDARLARRWLRRAELDQVVVNRSFSPRRKLVNQWTAGLLGNLLASGLVFRASRR